jgi:two-component system, OmpR family, sensor histidine kinase KdpD
VPPQERDFDRRPDPDALLAVVEEDRRGKLRIFLGAAPGVGKTYAMLARARAAKVDGVDVVIGLAETHGRQETEALTKGLEILPRRKCESRGHVIEEFDIDAALARKPKLIIVDELAHTNAPDSRHLNDGRMSRNYVTPASMSGRHSTFSIWRVSRTSSRASPA